MKVLSSIRLLPIICAGALIAIPTSTYADRDHGGGSSRGGTFRGESFRGGRGNFHGGGGNWHGGHGGFGGGRWHGGYGYGYGGWGWGGPFFWGPAWGVSVYDYPDDYYSGDGRVYRGIRRDENSDNLAVDVQRSLKRRGYYDGAIDGVAGGGTRAAIRAYQADRRLPVTGRMDGALIRSLGL